MEPPLAGFSATTSKRLSLAAKPRPVVSALRKTPATRRLRIQTIPNSIEVQSSQFDEFPVAAGKVGEQGVADF
jgi:hypothetical protein